MIINTNRMKRNTNTTQYYCILLQYYEHAMTMIIVSNFLFTTLRDTNDSMTSESKFSNVKLIFTSLLFTIKHSLSIQIHSCIYWYYRKLFKFDILCLRFHCSLPHIIYMICKCCSDFKVTSGNNVDCHLILCSISFIYFR